MLLWAARVFYYDSINESFNAPIINYQTLNFSTNSLQLDVTYTGSNGGNSKGDRCIPVTRTVRFIHIDSNGGGVSPQYRGKPFNAPSLGIDLIDWEYNLFDWRLEEDSQRNPKPCLEIVEVGCHFSLFKENKLVYKRVEQECPKVSQNQCPNGTCAVPCGSNICCYDSDGIPVSSIPFV